MENDDDKTHRILTKLVDDGVIDGFEDVPNIYGNTPHPQDSTELARYHDVLNEEFELNDPPHSGWCDRYEVHPQHTYHALNGTFYACAGLTSNDLVELHNRSNQTCAHGLSLDLCVDPINHYPPDNYY